MKVVLFCGGQGLRIRDVSEHVPKPMIRVGYRPILWHLMKYYAHFGHTEFILCLGHQADVVKSYFLNYDEAISNDFVLTQGGRQVQLLNSDISGWSITFVDTGKEANIGQRLMAVRGHLGSDEMFLANYADALTDAPLPAMVERLERSDAVACMMLVNPPHSFHVARADADGTVAQLCQAGECGLSINGGFFTFRRDIFDFMQAGEELVEQPFERLMGRKKLIAYPHPGFWGCMDTFKDKTRLDDLYDAGGPPWELWKPPAKGG